MNYELAKQLKDAGFVQRQWKYAFHYHPTEKNEGGEHMIYLWQDIEELGVKDSIYIPDLKELIKACGDEFATLVKCGCRDCKWNCYGKSRGGWLEDEDINGSLNGMTPEEAVAKLWLELNKK